MATFKGQLVEDLDNVIFNTDEFAEDITYSPSGGSPYSLKGIFDHEYEDINPETNEAIVSEQPNVQVDENKLQAEPKPNDEVTIRSVVYKVIKSEKNGVGVTRILLHRKIS